VQKFAAGGLISAPTLAVLGDSPSGGAANEAVMPLDSPEAMAKIAAALGPHLGGGGGHHFNMNVRGMISDQDAKKLAKKLSRMVRQGTTQLHSSNTLRVTKRSA
jgi:hypothetical protein